MLPSEHRASGWRWSQRDLGAGGVRWGRAREALAFVPSET